MSGTLGAAGFKLAFQISPIILTGGITGSMPGGALPIVALTEAINFPFGILSSGINIELDGFFANFQPLSGMQMISQELGKFPFANQAVAANATITNSRTLSMMMICPARDEAGYATKLLTMMALKAALTQHNSLGGTYTIITPSMFETNCILKDMRSADNGQSKQVQIMWQLDFERPLLTLEDAAAAQNSLMSKLTAGTQLSGTPAWSGLPPTVGNASSLASPSLFPVATTGAGTTTAPLIPVTQTPLPAPTPTAPSQ